ncbi:sugar transferase [Prevotella sp. S7 MS 2]|uniref:sugar transferase n=1 Tax=Prevotella sp. S7 MS 2 TaxID=1287488 RepID=UPI000A05A434|nr:sugar transferase [Prevotella sp. S7 MS 2]
MKQSGNRNDLIRILVAIGDFLVLNVTLWAFIVLMPNFVPSFSHVATKMTLLVANFSMLVSQMLYHTIIHLRRVNFEDALSRVFKLSACQAVVMYVMLRMIGVQEQVLYCLLLLFPAVFFFLMVTRLIQRVLLKHYRQMGRNTRTVLFIGLMYPIIAMCIKLQSPGPGLFKQQRTGLNGQTFNCLKFRSMHVNADSDKQQATKDDPRKFAFGNFMRKTNIDELPQFFNVLKGDMSIVGPRPHMLYHTDVYRDLIDKYMVRHFSKPGITGWTQITGFRGETKELWQMEERIKRDICYIEHWSFWLDIKIIMKTAIEFMIPDKRAY